MFPHNFAIPIYESKALWHDRFLDLFVSKPIHLKLPASLFKQSVHLHKPVDACWTAISSLKPLAACCSYLRGNHESGNS
jgi:hypothetical protein